MEKTITIGNKAIAFKATGATALRYRSMFNDDLITKMIKLGNAAANGETVNSDDLLTLERAAFVMAKQAGDETKTLEDWLDQFEMFEIIEALPDIMELWGLNMVATSEAKKK